LIVILLFTDVAESRSQFLLASTDFSPEGDTPRRKNTPLGTLTEHQLHAGEKNVIVSACEMLNLYVIRCLSQVSPYVVANGSGCYAPYYSATAAQNPVVIPSSAPALTEATPTGVPPTTVAQPCPHPDVRESIIKHRKLIPKQHKLQL